ncbi:Hypothetical predicted protein [Cloeon dipterum]|uniref:Uncharacterized protein n=1 Tax=Cloeon dipterum TaxID=197152 RepID=A0A8S1CJU5_9INSE|nr:Hypothetical predicted protein [Cloeon dipterum]
MFDAHNYLATDSTAAQWEVHDLLVESSQPKQLQLCEDGGSVTVMDMDLSWHRPALAEDAIISILQQAGNRRSSGDNEEGCCQERKGLVRQAVHD